MDHNKVLPQWAPRVPQALIRRFYAADAQGIYDDVLQRNNSPTYRVDATAQRGASLS
jgi:hypothetical protein